MNNKFTMELVWHSCTDCLPEENYNPCLYVTDGEDIFEVEWENPPNGKQAFYEACPWPDSLCIKPKINSDGWWWADLYQTIKGEPRFRGLIVDDLVDIVDDVTKEEIEQYMKSTTKEMIVDYVSKYTD